MRYSLREAGARRTGSGSFLMMATALLLAAGLAGCGGGGDAGPGAANDNAGRSVDQEQTVTQEMISIPPGEFIKGNKDATESAEKQSKVTLKEGFKIDKYETTNAMYKRFLDSLPEDERAKRMPQPDQRGFGGWTDGWYPKGEADHPVTNIGYADAYAFARFAGKRLPHRLEWEYAARGTDGRIYPWGDQWDRSKANAQAGVSGGTKKVGSFPEGQSPFGCLDMAGNVAEWTATYFDKNNRVRFVVGGTFNETDLEALKCYNRTTVVEDTVDCTVGFRCAQDA